MFHATESWRIVGEVCLGVFCVVTITAWVKGRPTHGQRNVAAYVGAAIGIAAMLVGFILLS